MKDVRLATPEEVETLKEHSDLQFATNVYSFGNARAVFRWAPELDPVDFADSTTNEKRAFISYLETHMRLNGLAAYYFNVPDTEEYAHYRSVLDNHGYVRTGSSPEIRYKKPLV